MPNPSIFVPLFLQSALLPLMLALAVLLLLRKSALASWAPLLAVVVGFLGSYFWVYSAQWSVLPHQSLDWLPWIALLAGAGALLSEHSAAPLLRHGLRLAVSLGSAVLIAWPAVLSGGMTSPALPIGGAGLLIYLAWTYLGATAVQRPTPAFMLAVLSGGGALVLMLDSSQLLGQLSGALATTVLACLIFNVSRLQAALSGAATGLVVVLLGALLFNAQIYASFSLGHLALLLAGLLADPLVAGVNRLRQRASDMASWLTAGALTAVPVLTTIGLAIRAAQEAGGY